MRHQVVVVLQQRGLPGAILKTPNQKPVSEPSVSDILYGRFWVPFTLMPTDWLSRAMGERTGLGRLLR